MPMTRRTGFTLLELTMVIAVIGALAAILLPALARAREMTRRASCMSNLVELNMALQMYASEHQRQLPWSGNGNVRCINRLRNDYLPDYRVLICPSAGNYSDMDNQWRNYLKEASGAGRSRPAFAFTNYVYIGWFTDAPIFLPPPEAPTPRIPLMWDMAGKDQTFFNHVPGGSNVVFMDGSTEFVLFPNFSGPNLPTDPPGVTIGDTSLNPWDKWVQPEMPTSRPRRARP